MLRNRFVIMDTHNNSAAVAKFFETAKPLIHGDVILRKCLEVSAKGG